MTPEERKAADERASKREKDKEEMKAYWKGKHEERVKAKEEKEKNMTPEEKAKAAERKARAKERHEKMKEDHKRKSQNKSTNK